MPKRNITPEGRAVMVKHAKRLADLNRGKPCSDERRRNISLARMGHEVSEETRQKISEAQMGEKNHWFGTHGPNYGKPSPFRGRTHSEETKAKIKAARAKQVCSEETREKMRLAHSGSKNHNYGKAMSEKQKEQISKSLSGENNPNFGKPLSEATRIKISEKNSGENHYNYGGTITKEHKAKISAGVTGEKNPNWIGGRTEYCHKFLNGTLRHRVRAYFNNTCMFCGEPAYENETLDVHHVYYNKKACCEVSPDGKYYTDLGFKGKPKSFEIVGEPNKFVPLHHKCHTKTTAADRETRARFARFFESLINNEHGGKCYLTEQEYEDCANAPIEQ